MYKPDNYFPGVDPVNDPGLTTTLSVYTTERELIEYKQVVQYRLMGVLEDYPENFSEWFGYVTYKDPCQDSVVIATPSVLFQVYDHYVKRGNTVVEGLYDSDNDFSPSPVFCTL